MGKIINIYSLIKHIVTITIIVSLCIYYGVSYVYKPIPFYRLITIAPWVCLFIIFLLSNSTISRLIWGLICWFNKSLYPDLNGHWEGKITTENNLEIHVRATIIQTLSNTQINIHTETSKSETLEATPSHIHGTSKLFYLYRSIPKTPSWSIYTGMTIFDIRRINFNNAQTLELSGAYFTDRKSVGRISLVQKGTDINKDISFY